MDAPFNRSIFNQPLTYKSLRRLATSIGWSENKTQGKGSHRTFTRKGYREITFPCHRENHEYQRGQTRKFLKQILEPLADVCQVPVQGIHTVEQVETIVSEMLEYLPSQVQREYEQAIAESKATLDRYEAEKKSEIESRLTDYEEARLEDCEKTIRDLASETPTMAQPLLGLLILHYTTLSQEIQAQFEAKRNRLHTAQAEHQKQTQSLSLEIQTLQQVVEKQERTVSDLNLSLTERRNLIQKLKKERIRDRILMFGFLGLSVCLGAVLIHRDVTRPSPKSDLPISYRQTGTLANKTPTT